MVKPGKFQELVAKAMLSYLHRIWVLFYSIISQRKAGNQSQADYQRIHLLKKKFVTMRDHLGKKWIGSNWKGRQTVRSIGKNFKWQEHAALVLSFVIFFLIVRDSGGISCSTFVISSVLSHRNKNLKWQMNQCYSPRADQLHSSALQLSFI